MDRVAKFNQTSGVRILKGRYRPERMDTEEATDHIRLTAPAAVWRKPVFPKRLRRRRQRQRYIRQHQETMRNLNTEHYMTEDPRCKREPRLYSQTEFKIDASELASIGDTRTTCFRCAKRGHLARYCHEIPNRQEYRRWRTFKRQMRTKEEEGNYELQVDAPMD